MAVDKKDKGAYLPEVRSKASKQEIQQTGHQLGEQDSRQGVVEHREQAHSRKPVWRCCCIIGVTWDSQLMQLTQVAEPPPPFHQLFGEEQTEECGGGRLSGHLLFQLQQVRGEDSEDIEEAACVGF